MLEIHADENDVTDENSSNHRPSFEVVTEKKLECPFTWQMDEKLAVNFDNEMFVNVEDQPIKALIHSVTLIYVHVLKKDLQTAYAKVKETSEILKSMNFSKTQEEGISIKVLMHVVRASKHFYYKARGNLVEAKKTLEEIPLLEAEQLSDAVNNGTLNGCKSLSWSVFHDAPKSIAITYATRAVSSNPSCALWHFILAKKLRHMRKDDSNFEPLPDERTHLLQAYEISRSHYYGVYVAQLLSDSMQYDAAKKINMEIFKSDPQSIGIRLRLALSFIRSKDFDYAKHCLDFVQIRCPENSMYLHYKGIFFEKQKNYQMAALYFSKAAASGNYKADVQYAKCMKLVNTKFNCIKHLDEMLSKYNKSVTLMQQIFLHVAMQFYFCRIDVSQALTYFLKALQLNPRGKQLKRYYNSMVDNKQYNIIEFVYNKVLPEIHQNHQPLPYYLSDVILGLEEVYPSCCGSINQNQMASSLESIESK